MKNPLTIHSKFSLLAAVFLSTGISASATPSVNYSGGVATGISGLHVGGTIYNVTFEYGSYNAVFAGSSPTFLGNYAGANAAANAMLAALSAEPVPPVIGNGGPFGVLWTVYSVDATSFRATQAGYEGSAWQQFGDIGGDTSTDQSWRNWAFAKFTVVPEPASLSLVALGIASWSVLRRKR